jgi:hypothetical protein
MRANDIRRNATFRLETWLPIVHRHGDGVAARLSAAAPGSASWLNRRWEVAVPPQVPPAGDDEGTQL